mmetsp:Transcript_26891/g.43708  ORF Transcript_26891/g.43708 Transcript_26891/m.43708 type:complete len:84 (-) Transcript_26891:1172-1423(-)
MLLHPRIIETNAETSCGLDRMGVMEAYVSSKDSWTFTARSVGIVGVVVDITLELSPPFELLLLLGGGGVEGEVNTEIKRGKSL